MRVRLAGLSAWQDSQLAASERVCRSHGSKGQRICLCDRIDAGNPIAPALAGIRFFHDKIASFCLDDDDLLPLLYEVTARDGVQDMAFDIHFAGRAKD